MIRPTKTAASTHASADRRLEADPVTMADRVLERMGPVIAGPPRWQRIVLLVAAIVQLGLAAPWLAGSDPSGLLGDAYPSHLARDGALGLLIGAAAIVVARRPHHSLSALIAGVSILAIQLSTGLIDGHLDRVVLWVETTHVPTLVIVALLAVISRPERNWKRSSPTRSAERAAEPASVTELAPLRSVPPAPGD